MASRIEGEKVIDYQDSLTDLHQWRPCGEIKEQLDAVSKEINSRIGDIVDVGMRPRNLEAKITAWRYVHGYGVPNMYFHLVAACNIERKEGGDIGKLDYLLPFILPFIAEQIPKEMSERLELHPPNVDSEWSCIQMMVDGRIAAYKIWQTNHGLIKGPFTVR